VTTLAEPMSIPEESGMTGFSFGRRAESPPPVSGAPCRSNAAQRETLSDV
jgi:hypothetical protein